MTEPDPKFEALLEFLRRSRGFDFTAYKRSTLMRRCYKRMQAVGAEDYQEYGRYLEANPDEFERLFDTILINVTSFYRDKSPWDFVRDEILPAMLERRGPGQRIRVWSAGCSTGEEAYTLAMLLAETLSRLYGEGQALEILSSSVQIYATDVDEHALQQARRASYAESAVEPLPRALRDKYLEPSGGRYTVQDDLRRCVIFGRHDLIQDPPLSRLDLLVCRNTLMYFHSDAQRRILNRFHLALKDAGYLFLGRAEMLLTHTHLYTPVDLGHRVFSKVQSNSASGRRLVHGRTGGETAPRQPGEGPAGGDELWLAAAILRGRDVERRARCCDLNLDGSKDSRGTVPVGLAPEREGNGQGVNPGQGPEGEPA